MEVAGFTEVGRLLSVAVKHPRDAFVDERTIAAQWKELGFLARPDIGAAIDEFEQFLAILRSTGASIALLPRDAETTLDSIYARDASIVSPNGLILARMGKPARQSEPAAMERACHTLPIESPISGRVSAHGLLEGGDVVWLDPHTLVIGCGYRTNAEGIDQVRTLVGNGSTSSVCRCPTGMEKPTSCT